ncbi:MAG: mercury resistance system transport protein MerF [Alphaproteobacteria bacterium]|jgi:mercuric ion transport protein|nr:mercury resistance system transport protein MerF [Alphaproteobacteria bacterium]
MKNQVLFRIGLVGTVIAAICCFTPALVLGLTALGLAGAAAKIDSVLIPVLGAFVAFTFWAYSRRDRD